MPETLEAPVKLKPAAEAAVAPRDTAVEPKVTELFVNDELPIFDNVFDEPLIVLFVSVFDVPENKVSNCDNNTLPSLPPSDNNILSPATSVALSKSVAPSIFTIASTLPNSNALAPEFTFNT